MVMHIRYPTSSDSTGSIEATYVTFIIHKLFIYRIQQLKNLNTKIHLYLRSAIQLYKKKRPYKCKLKQTICYLFQSSNIRPRRITFEKLSH